MRQYSVLVSKCDVDYSTPYCDVGCDWNHGVDKVHAAAKLELPGGLDGTSDAGDRQKARSTAHVQYYEVHWVSSNRQFFRHKSISKSAVVGRIENHVRNRGGGI